MHRAACGRASGLRGGAEVLGKGVLLCGGGRRSSAGMGCEVGGRASRSLRACVGAAWGSGSARDGRVAVRGREKVFGGEGVVGRRGMHRAACGRVSGLRGGAGVLGKGVSLCGGEQGLRRGMSCEGCGECIAQPAGVRRGCVGERRCSGRACRCAGASEGLRREWVVRSAGLTHIRRSSTRARVLLYIRPACPRREIAAMGPKDAPCEHPSPAKTSAPAPSAFTLPRPRSPSPAYPLASRRMMFAPSAATFTLPPRRSQFSHEAFGGAHEDFGLPQQQLSTIGYPRKSYPHCCSPPCAKRSRPRACARV